MVDALFRTDEQRLLADTAARLFAAPEGLAQRIAEVGLLALPIAERDGGLRADDATDGHALAIVFAAKGAAFAVETALFQAVHGGTMLAASQAAGARALLPAIAEGRARIAVALHEAGIWRDVFAGKACAERIGTGWRLDGTKTLALGGGEASHLLVLARTGDGPALFLLDRATTGLELLSYVLRDGTPAADVHLHGLTVDPDALVLAGQAAASGVESAAALARLCLAAEAAGLMRAAVDGTIRYTAERQQFGKPIGSFQVIQHRLADMAVATDQAAALVAQMAADVTDNAAIARAHRAIGELGMTTLKAAIQLHGGYGMTEDLPYGRALRRMMTISALF